MAGHDSEAIFFKLRSILKEHAAEFAVTEDTPRRYCLEGGIGPATLLAWGGKAKKKAIPVAWVQVGKAAVSYHLMGAYGNRKLLEGMSRELKARMHGKSCFNFKTDDPVLFKELEGVTALGLSCFRKSGFVL
jgi:hypothetical protein